MHGNEQPGERKQALSVQRLANAVMSVTPYYTHIKRKMAYKSGSTMIPQADMNLQIQESCLLSCLSCLPFCCRLSFQKLFLYVAVYLLLCFKTFQKSKQYNKKTSTKLVVPSCYQVFNLAEEPIMAFLTRSSISSD